MRWECEAEEALQSKGYEKVDQAGVSDWQGWGVLLGKNAGGGYATLWWSYGSCSGCDQYEDMPAGQVVESLAADIDEHATETEARAKFEEYKGRGW